MNNFNGFLNIVKPTGMTSSDVVCKVKKILGTKKVGHLGTLDPAASGVLPIAVGSCTKFFEYFLSKDKEYVAVVKFGVLTDTLDSFGNIVSQDNKKVFLNDLKDVIKDFKGKIVQTPPKFSAIKINGEKACDLARRGIDFEIKSREIEIFDIEILNEIEENLFRLKVHCSAGTYIRTLFNDIAQKLGTTATVPVIIRTKSGPFEINQAVTLEDLERDPKVILLEQIFAETEKFEVDSMLAKKIISGQNIKTKEINQNLITKQFFITFEGKVIGLFKTNGEKIERIVFIWAN